MSKALLKKSLAFVKSRTSESDSVKTGEKMGVKKKNQNSSTNRNGFQPQSGSKNLKTAEGSSSFS